MSILYYIFDKATNKIISCESIEKYAELISENPNYADRTIAKTSIEDVDVSTVFLMLDHVYGSLYGSLFGSQDDPVLFETMIFGGPHDSMQWRYASVADAREGHEVIVSLLKAGLNPDEFQG